MILVLEKYLIFFPKILYEPWRSILLKLRQFTSLIIYILENMDRQMITGAVFIDLKKDLTWSTMNVCFLS